MSLLFIGIYHQNLAKTILLLPSSEFQVSGFGFRVFNFEL